MLRSELRIVCKYFSFPLVNFATIFFVCPGMFKIMSHGKLKCSRIS